MNHPNYATNRGQGGAQVSAATPHDHAYLTPLSLNREGIRLQCGCGRVVIFTPYIEIELPSKEPDLEERTGVRINKPHNTRAAYRSPLI